MLSLFMLNVVATCGLYDKNITIANNTSKVIRKIPQLGASLMIIILMAQEASFMLLELLIMLTENIYSVL